MPTRLFTDSQEAEIARRYLAGESLRAMAREFGTAHHVLSGSLRRQSVTQRDAAERNRLYSLNAHAFDVIDSEAAAYWLGFLFADGNVSRRTVALSLKGADSEHVRRFGQFLQAEHVVRASISATGHGVATIQVTDLHLTDRLRELGIETHRPRPLLSLESVPGELQHHWIRGFFDGNGSIKLSASAGFCGKKPTLEAVREIVSPIVGRTGSLYAHSKSPVWYLSYAGRLSCNALAAYLYQDATVFLDRKRHRFESLPIPAANHWERTRDNGRWKQRDKN